jgi:hypothetical protein
LETELVLETIVLPAGAGGVGLLAVGVGAEGNFLWIAPLEGGVTEEPGLLRADAALAETGPEILPFGAIGGLKEAGADEGRSHAGKGVAIGVNITLRWVEHQFDGLIF